MVATASTMLALGTPAPEFDLVDVIKARKVSLESFAGKKALLVMFISRHCPYVQHVVDELVRLGEDYAAGDIGIVAICSNDYTNHPDDAPDQLRAMALGHGFKFLFCFDSSQEVAKSYTAACTPDFFLFDGNRKLAYRGQLDDSRPGNGKPVTGRDLRAAIDALLEGRAVPSDQKPSLGCNIKWKPGNEPAYFKSA